MTVNQISVFVENQPGKLAELTEVLSENQINLRALSIADTRDFGILRIIVSDVEKTTKVLTDADYIFSITPVLAVPLPDQPGSLSLILRMLAKEGIDIEYTYAFLTRHSDSAYMVFRVEDNEKAIAVLAANGIATATQEEIG